jgi:hypothetical protein
MRIEGDSIVVATTSQISCVLDKDTVILHFDKGHYFGLNELGSLIWNQVQQPRRFAKSASLFCANMTWTPASVSET